MKKQAEHPSTVTGLRRLAEARLRDERRKAPRTRALSKTTKNDSKFVADQARLLHELQVHQVELEMQNSELEESRVRMEMLVDKYADLYDFAPVGYFTLDDRTRILDANLTGSALLGVERSRLLGTSLDRFLSQGGEAVFHNFLGRVFAETEPQICETTLRRERGATFCANLYGAPLFDPEGRRRGCRVAVSDITPLVKAREEAQRVEALRVTNRELRHEIARRRVVESALKKSQNQNARLLQQSQVTQEQLRHVSYQVLQAQEEERRRISRELHDDITQTLVGITVHLEALAQAASVNPESLKARVAKTQRLVEQSIVSVRQFARELRPALLDDLGLIPALHAYLEDFTQRTGIKVRFRAFAGVEKLSGDRRTVLYRVAQSALVNVANHAEASRVLLGIWKVPGAVRMEIRDNGRSFDAHRVMNGKRTGHLGLIGMRERGEMIGGTFAVVSAPGKGTTVCLQIPAIP
jgi:PAS domain S-box-containing protein